MQKLIVALGSIGSSGVLAAGSWFIYDNVNPTLAKQYKDQWKPITLTITKPPTSSTEDTSYKGSSCFQRFFGLTIQNFSTATASETSSSESQTFGSLFENTNSDIYGCAIGINWGFYELVLKNEEVGFATWYYKNKDDQKYQQKSFELKKSGSTWQIEKGIWSTYDTQLATNDFTGATQIKRNTNNKPWSWWFYMPKDQASTNMQEWKNVFYKETTQKSIYDATNKEWKSGSISSSGKGNIPKFNQVKDLTNLCNEKGNIRNHTIKEEDNEKKKLEIFCLSSNQQHQ